MIRLHVPRSSRTFFFLSSFISLLMLLITISSYFRLQPELPLFYSLAQSESQLAHKGWLFLLPAMALFITASHLLIILTLKRLEPVVIKLFSAATILVQSLFLLALVRILFIIA